MKASNYELALRINAAQQLLRSTDKRTEVKAVLMDRFGVSARQAYRYLDMAEKHAGPVRIPEEKVVFTVKIAASLAQEVRTAAGKQQLQISSLVESALSHWVLEGGSLDGNEKGHSR